MENLLRNIVENGLPFLTSEGSNFLSLTGSFIKNNLLFIKISLILLIVLIVFAVIYLFIKSLDIIESHKGLDIYDFFGFKKIKYKEEIDKIDLQIHTIHSDGLNSPIDILKLASKKGLDVIAITDYDTTSGFKEVKDESENYGLILISGVEISTSYQGYNINVLGYNIDIENEHLKGLLDDSAIIRKKHFINQVPVVNKTLEEAKKGQVDSDKYKKKELRYFSMSGLISFLVEEKVVKNREEGRNFIKNVSPFIPPVTSWDAFQAINQAGGKSFISHPFGPKISLRKITEDKNDQEKIIREFIKDGLNGLEVYQSAHNEEDVEFALSLANKYDLLISAGSDWHGPIKETGDSIKDYLPNYPDNLGELEVPQDKIDKILKGLNLSNIID